MVPRLGWLQRIAVIAAILVAVAGLWASGSPQRARLVALDEQRSNDLESLARRDRTATGARTMGLPDSLARLTDRPGGPFAPVLIDPVTRERYGYRMLDSTTYELCATFDSPSESPDPVMAGREPRSRFRTHDGGRVCFPVRVRRIP